MITAEPALFARLAEALRQGAPPLCETSIAAFLTELAQVQFDAEGAIDSAGLTLERVEALRESLNARRSNISEEHAE